MHDTPEASGSAQFLEADWLTLDGVQTGHTTLFTDGAAEPGALDAPMWLGKSSYLPVRKMYETPRPDGKARPVIDLEPHYENTHHQFDVSTRATSLLVLDLKTRYQRAQAIWRARDIRIGGWQAVSYHLRNHSIHIR